MAKERKAHVVYYEPHGGDSASLAELNTLLNDGWLPIATAAMGGASTGIDSDPSAGSGQALAPQSGFAALVILERQKDHAVSGFGS